jgi:chromosome partitioning protein
VVVIGNQKGGCGKSTVAMHLIVALLKAGKRVASFDLDIHQQTLTHYVENRRKFMERSAVALELPDHHPIADDLEEVNRQAEVDEVSQFLGHIQMVEQNDGVDFIVIDTPGGVQHLNTLAHGMADTLITPVNDSLVDLDTIVMIDTEAPEPQPACYAQKVAQALAARRRVSGRETDWFVVRNRLQQDSSSNQRQVKAVLDIIAPRLGFRTLPGLHDRTAFREFFAAGLTTLDSAEIGRKTGASGLMARLEVEQLVSQLGLWTARSQQECNFGDDTRELETAAPSNRSVRDLKRTLGRRAPRS